MEVNSHRHKNNILLPSNKDLCRQKFFIIQQYKRSHFLSCKNRFENNAIEITVSSKITQHTTSRGRNTIHVAKRNTFSQRSNPKESGGNIPRLPAEESFIIPRHDVAAMRWRQERDIPQEAHAVTAILAGTAPPYADQKAEEVDSHWSSQLPSG